MKKILLTLALVITLCNLSLGIAYAAVCQSSKGARACGNTCATNPGGTCECQGACSADEREWVSGAHALIAEEEFAY